MSHRPFLALLLPFTVLLAFTLALGACGDEPLSGPDGDTEPDTAGIDPGSRTFELMTIESTTGDGRVVPILLVGRDLKVDEDAREVSLEIAIRNLSNFDLHPQALVWIHALNPDSVWPINADIQPWDVSLAGDPRWGFDYSNLLGDDGVLSSGELSASKTWIFSDPELIPFSFAAEGQFGLPGGRAHIAGHIFHDDNRNGRWDEGEEPFPAGWVRLPLEHDFAEVKVPVGPRGAYALPVNEAGHYTVAYEPPPIMAPIPIIMTTPNPLEVVLLPTSDGGVQSYDDADFGVFFGPLIPPVIITDTPPDSLGGYPYSLIGLELDGRILHMRVGFSGCDGGHPFQLFMTGGFMESMPVQVRLQLVHDSRDELCLAVFEEGRAYDLLPILAAYREAYGQIDPILLNFYDYNGVKHQLLFEPENGGEPESRGAGPE